MCRRDERGPGSVRCDRGSGEVQLHLDKQIFFFMCDGLESTNAFSSTFRVARHVFMGTEWFRMRQSLWKNVRLGHSRVR